MNNRVEKHAYHFGGAEGVEPSGTYKSEDYHKYWDTDKHMHPNPSSTGGTDGMYPGDKETKEKQKRASYSGPALKTRLTQRRNLDGSLDKAASKFEVFAGDKLVIATTAGTIYGNKLGQYWDFLTSPEYGKLVVSNIREKGLAKVASLLTKTAQELPAELPGEMPAADPSAQAAPALSEPVTEAPLGDGLDGGDDLDPKAVVEEAFLAIEDAIAQGQEALSGLNDGGGVQVNIGDVGGELEGGDELVPLASQIVGNLKVVLADADQSADELALISATYDNYRNLTSKQRAEFNNMTRHALKDSAEIVGETKALLSMARLVVQSISKVAEYTETGMEATRRSPAKTAPKAAPRATREARATVSNEDTLIAEALEREDANPLSLRLPWSL